MFRIATVLAASAIVFALAAPAQAATTFNFGGAGTTLATGAALTQSQDGITVSATAWSFGSTTPAAFQALADGAEASDIIAGMSAKKIRREATGIGVCWSGEAGNQCNQVDSDGTNELLRIEVSEKVSLVSAKFDRVDFNDTLKLYGVTAGGIVEHLGYGGIFDGPGTTMGVGGLTGAWLSGTGDDQVYTVTFNTTGYKEFWFGNNNDAADGYRLDSVTVAGVPEPATWALMIGGFGLAGAALRRRRTAIAA